MVLFSIWMFSSVLIAAQSEPELGWPRQIDIPEGKIVIYQPDFDSFEGNILEGRSAISVTPTGKNEPVFGAFWFKCRVDTDSDERMVYLFRPPSTPCPVP